MKPQTNTIPAPNGIVEIVTKIGNTQDIIEAILQSDENYNSADFCTFAQQFSSTHWKIKNTMHGLYNLWYFVRYRIHYKEDPAGYQFIQTPSALWRRGIGDCKSKTLFITAVLRCIGIPYKIRFSSYGTKDVKHVYPVAIVNGKSVVLDAVWTKFATQAPYSYIVDYNTNGGQISGIKRPINKVLSKRKNNRYCFINKKL